LLSVNYPSHYQLGLDSPNRIIAYFLYSDYNHNVAKILQIVILGDPSVIDDKKVRESFQNEDNYDLCSLPDSEIKSMIASQGYQQYSRGLSISPNFKKKTVNGVCGITYSAANSFSEEGIPIFTVIDAFLIGYMNKTVIAPRYVYLHCDTTGYLEQKNTVISVHNSDTTGVCNQFFNSLKIYDRLF
jgi:hypothetical protein